MTSNTKITKISIDNNTFSHKYLDELNQICLRNKSIEKTNTVPKFKGELGQLIALTHKEHQDSKPLHLQEKRHRFIRQATSLNVEREEGVREIYEGEDVISYMQHREEEMMNEFRRIKEANDRKLELLDGEFMRVEKKDGNKEQWIRD